MFTQVLEFNKEIGHNIKPAHSVSTETVSVTVDGSNAQDHCFCIGKRYAQP
jgi:hypothetical protein